MVPGSGRKQLNVAELFAGVGGFRVGLERVSPDFRTTFSSQWEPPGSEGKQFASRCYVSHFGSKGHFNEDIAKVLNRVERGEQKLGRIHMVVGGFPCQDYSVAKPLNQSAGLVGKKGVLWWQIHRLLDLLKKSGKPAEWILLENVDRLLKSPAMQRGRDFAIMLASLSDLGYEVEWRVVNAADYGFPQKRRRVFIVARRQQRAKKNGAAVVYESGILARALPVHAPAMLELSEASSFTLTGELDEVTREFGRGVERNKFGNAGYMRAREVWTYDTKANYRGRCQTLGDILVDDDEASAAFTVAGGSIASWKYVKGSKSEARVHKSGFTYHYTEGALPFPDPANRAARTILTSEGGSGPSRSKHVVAKRDGGLRRLVPVELERLNGFDDDWTATGMSDSQRAFCMGNALVVGLVEMIGTEIARESRIRTERRAALRAG